MTNTYILDKMISMFGAVLVTGARQVGKTTLLKQCKPEYSYVSLDDINELSIAKEDSMLFMKEHAAPVIIDEIQYAPSLFPTIKLIIDKENISGQFLMSGSQFKRYSGMTPGEFRKLTML